MGWWVRVVCIRMMLVLRERRGKETTLKISSKRTTKREITKPYGVGKIP